MNVPIVTVPIQRIEKSASQNAQDLVAVEEPLQIRISLAGEVTDLAVTMRTPGHDSELAAGFLLTEGIIRSSSDVEEIVHTGPGEITFRLKHDTIPAFSSRKFYVTSSCGICGKASVDALREAGCTAPPRQEPIIRMETLQSFPRQLIESQAVFERTGGLHGAGLFDSQGQLSLLREDVGRHNAVDKLVGGSLLGNRLPLHGHILMLSGRISFELVQKAVMAGIPFIAAVGAPSSLAIETALQFGLTLVGFLRNERANIYCGAERLAI